MIRIGRSARVGDSSEVAGARRIAAQCAEELRFSTTVTGKIALVATELATNLLKHGGGGLLLLGSEEDAPQRSMVLIALDKGPGIANVPTALKDGYSTAGSAGEGLGAVTRAAATFDIYSQADRGTAVLVRIEEDVPVKVQIEPPPRIVVGGVCMPKMGEDVSGDGWNASLKRDVVTIAVADGLGHGHAAATASRAFVRAFGENPDEDLPRMFETAHAAMRATRGAAVGVARIFPAQSRVDFVGVGNIAGTIASDEAVRRIVSLNGIVGHEMRKVQTFSYPWSASSALVLASDGISTSWNAASYPGLMQRDPALIAAVIYRDHCRGTDDATVVVARAS
jgi:anti-sigma regulatory factor (Ser/Thr protein kinase)/serine/threonine protein phosphatase PrpC